MILVLERRLEEFSRSIENRLLSIEDQIIGPCDTNRKSNNMSDNVFCLDLLKNWVVDLERQTTEKDAILVSYQSNLLIKTATVFLVMVQLLMTIMAVFMKELKLSIIISLWVKIINKIKVKMSS